MTQRRSWLFKAVEEINGLREKFNHNYNVVNIEKTSTGHLRSRKVRQQIAVRHLVVLLWFSEKYIN